MIRARKIILMAVCVVLVCAAAACSLSRVGGRPGAPGGPNGTIIVGVSGAFPENQIVAEMYGQVLERAGYAIERQFDLRSREVSHTALESGQIDLKPEYLSSLLLFLDPNAQVSGNPAGVARQIRQLLEPRGVTLLTPSPAEDTNEFVANAKTAQRFGLTTMSSLAP
ncbi:MAG TPA: glycine betaine ABC transporter substrate-binding protein, partial [Actinomycetota bacterium]|nr:glycine betaine ABC transporter substrate-binding protein [Actinomycetota bacterium]